MLWRSVLVAAAMVALCLGVDVLQPHRQEPVCPSQHSCSSRRASNASHLECSCDASCRKHADCCRDSEHYSADEQRRNVNEYVCIEDALAGNHVYVKAKCAAHWTNAEVQALCMRGNTMLESFSDIPVIGGWSRSSYINSYCAVCNGENPEDIKIWNMYMVCDAVPDLPGYSSDDPLFYEGSDTLSDDLPPITSDDDDSSDDYDIMYNEGRWGVIPRGSRDASAFTPCHTHFVLPKNLRRYTTQCLPTVKTCSEPGADQHDRSLCESYTAAVYHEDQIFRNQHCASCSGYKQFTCVQPAAAAAASRLALSFILIVPNFGTTRPSLCGIREMFDLQSSECRPIICPRPDEEFHYGKCVPVQAEATLSPRESFCPFHHSCSFPGVRVYSAGCSCDASCRLRGDCCRDSQYYNKTEQIKIANEYECVGSYFNDVYMKVKCLDRWNNTEEQALCLMGNTQTGDSKQFPVTSTTTATTYVNYYCALCNDEDTTNLRIWRAQIDCWNHPVNSYDEAYNLVFHEGKWGLIAPSLGLSSFKRCYFEFKVPANIEKYPTECRPVVKTCSDPRADQRDQILCQSYTAFVYNDLGGFRNEHCALCNGYKEYFCSSLEQLPSTPPSLFTMLFDFTEGSGNTYVGLKNQCGSGEVWGKSLNRCVKIICPKPNEIFVINKCVPKTPARPTPSHPPLTPARPTPFHPPLTPARATPSHPPPRLLLFTLLVLSRCYLH